MDKLRYGIIGIGKMGSTHAKKIFNGVDSNSTLTAVCDIDSKCIEWAKKTLSGVKVYTDYKELLQDNNVDAVIVATPHYLHPVIGKEALIACKHTLIEKPAGVYTAAVRELNEVALAHPDLKFGIMYNQRTNMLYLEAKTIIERGELGELKRINWIITNWYRPQAYYDQGGWRGTWAGEGGGVLINQCPHQIDLFQWLAGMPVKVRGYAQYGKNRNINVENDVTAYMEFANGGTGVFVTSTHDFPGTNRLEIVGDGGKIVIEGNTMVYDKLTIKESEFNKNNKEFMPDIPSTRVKKTYGLVKQIKDAKTGQHMFIIRNFSRAVLSGEKLMAPGIEGIRGLTLSNAIHLSSWLDKEVLIPFDEELFIKELEQKKAEELKAGLKSV